MAGDFPVSGGELRTPAGDAPVLPLAILGTGLYLAWFGIHYWRSDVKWPSAPVKAVLTGRPLPAAAPPPPYSAQLTADVTALAPDSGSSAAAGSTGAGSATGSGIADDALKYKNYGYVWGGNASQPGNWDCSSFASYVLGHDMHLPLPGGKWGDPGFPPAAHGPTTIQYLLYGTPLNRSQVAAGDLVVWNTHMGIAISGTQMISALDPQQGTRVTAIDGLIPGETAHYRRVTS